MFVRLLTAVTAACAAPRVVAFVRARWDRGAEPCRAALVREPAAWGSVAPRDSIYTYSSNKYLCLFSTEVTIFLCSGFGRQCCAAFVPSPCPEARQGSQQAGRQGERGGHWWRKPLPCLPAGRVVVQCCGFNMCVEAR